MTELRVSVRELVAFSYFSEDILPGGSASEMLAGTRAHGARESGLPDNAHAERAVKRAVALDDESVTVHGRIDVLYEGEPPLIEEIKHCARVPDEALPEHRAQAALYGALLTLETGAEEAALRVAYVDEQGELLRAFDERQTRAELLETLERLLRPWLQWAVQERAHQAERDASLRAALFPFERYRAGQRELAVQVYTAVARKKRLFASLPTGTGKSAAVLYPALKAMGEGKTNKVVYLTARTTARQSPLAALERMRAQGMHLRVSTLLAKEKLCPGMTRCHPDDCPRAKGYYLRQPEGVAELLQTDAIWTETVLTAVADRHCLCPFELALTMVDYADVALMDLNYAFDPFAQMQRLFGRRRDFTVLIDEAHHLLDRVRESLSGTLDSRVLSGCRAAFGKAMGRKHPYYKALGELIRAVRAAELPPANATDEGELDALPPGVEEATEALLPVALATLGERLPAGVSPEVMTVVNLCAPFSYAAAMREQGGYAILLQNHGRERLLELYCLSPAERIAQVTKPLRGAVFFSATLAPLADMRALLGGAEDDACFSLPSPFPAENLAVVRRRVNTRYQRREESAMRVAESIAEAVNARPGRYIAYFPSYAYLRLILEPLQGMDVPPLLVQSNDMEEDARERFLRAFTENDEPKLGLCVLGGLFSEGVDLPGEQLIGAIIVGVGLPTPSLRLKTLQAYYERRFGDGFRYACQIPAMQKVSQAGGRVIRTETDRGLILLLDDRYYDMRYQTLLPPEWRLQNEKIAEALKGWD